jgi:hypothetical protein
MDGDTSAGLGASDGGGLGIIRQITIEPGAGKCCAICWSANSRDVRAIPVLVARHQARGGEC